MRANSKESRLAKRYIPENSIEHKNTNGRGVAYTYELNGKLIALGYRGTAGKAEFHNSFRTEEQREKHVSDWLRSLDAHAEYIEKRREEYKASDAARAANGEYGLAETAKLVRQALAVAYPGVKFSVRSDSYSMGCSIDVSWTDGPRERDLRTLFDCFTNSDFDGMQDLKTYRGAVDYNGRKLKFTGDSVRGSRRISADLYREIADRVSYETGAPAIEVAENEHYANVSHSGAGGIRGFNYWPDKDVICRTDDQRFTLADIVWQIAANTSRAAATFDVHDRNAVYAAALAEAPAKPASKPEAPKASKPREESGKLATVAENRDKDGVEIRFPYKPDTRVLETLKGNGWRWSRFSECWYTKRSPEALAFARELAGVN